MTGINKLLDQALGYDDDYRSTEQDRTRYFVLFNAGAAVQGSIVRMVGSRSIVVRKPCNEGEFHLAELVRHTLQNLRNPPSPGPQVWQFPRLD